MPLPTDPLLTRQWHLGNPNGKLDLLVRGVWDPASGPGYTGLGVRVVVIDDGFDFGHSDLLPNHLPNQDYNFDSKNLNVLGNPDDSHGTAVAGIISAAANGSGAVGVAYGASLIGYLTHGFISDYWLTNIRDSIAAAATNAAADVVNISQGLSNDDTTEFSFGLNRVHFFQIEESINTALNQGRGGLGTTIVKSAGNARDTLFDINADEWGNDTRQVIVAAVDQNGWVSSYSSYGSAILVSGFGTPGEVVTTDKRGADGYNNSDYASDFNGTSAAAPMVAGVVSLMYEAEEGLGWRDVQSILAASARHVGSSVGAPASGHELYGWSWNGARTWNGGGLHFSNDYGYGLVNGLAAVRLAETWLLTDAAQVMANQSVGTADLLNASVQLVDGDRTGTVFSGNLMLDCVIERVTVTVSFSTTYLGDLLIDLISPGGMESRLMSAVDSSDDFTGSWTLESQAFRGERSAGSWNVRIGDNSLGDLITINDLVINVYGQSATDDRYVYTNEYSRFAGVAGHNTVLLDSNGGDDSINAAAVTSNLRIDLNPGVVGTIGRRAFSVVPGTEIENAIGGDGNDVLTGNDLSNLLFGGRGNDRLIGGGGADDLQGFAGDDLYILGDSTSDTITDTAGVDTIRSTIERSLLDFADIENLVLQGSGDVAGTGNNAANTITGNAGHNVLNGGAGEDILIGGLGSDTLIGGDGARDTFRYLLSSQGGDVIQDFDAADVFSFEGSRFGLANYSGALSGMRFVSKAADSNATTVNQRFVFNQSTSELWYDSNGSAAGGTKVMIADLTNNFNLTVADIVII